MNCTFCGSVKTRRPFELYIWFNHKNSQSYWNAMLNSISEKERLTKATKYGKKGPDTK